MAIFHFSTGIVSRGKGQSAIAKSAYDSRSALRDERTGEMKDYSDLEGLLFSGIFAPEDAPEWAKDREALWNAVELAEDGSTRPKQAQLARKIDLALPHELTDEQRRRLVTDFVREQFQRRGMVADVSIHAPDKDGDERNHHAHILLTMREITLGGFGNKVREWNDKEQLKDWREAWDKIANRYLERFGHEERIDHRSNEERGIDEPATVHLGPIAAAKERRGEATERGHQNRETFTEQQERAKLKSEIANLDRQISALEHGREETRRGGVEAAREATERREAPEPQPEAKKKAPPRGMTVRLQTIYDRCDSNRAFEAALHHQGIGFAVATEEEAERSKREAAFARNLGNYAPKYEAGEILAVTEPKTTRRESGETFEQRRVFKLDQDEARKFVAAIHDGPPQSVDATLRQLEERADEKKAERTARMYPFATAAQKATEQQEPAPPLRGMTATIHELREHSDSGKDFAAALRDAGIAFAVATEQEAAQSHRQALFARDLGNYAPQFEAGEIVAVKEPRTIRRESGETFEQRRVFKLDQDEARKFVATLRDEPAPHNVTETLLDLEEQARQKRNDYVWPVNAPQPDAASTSPQYHFADAARQATGHKREHRGMTARLQGLFEEADKAHTFTAVLEQYGIAFAVTTREEAERSHAEAEAERAYGRYRPEYQQGEIVAVVEPRWERRNEAGEKIEQKRVFKLDQTEAQKFIHAINDEMRETNARNAVSEIHIAEPMQRLELKGIEATILELNERAATKAANWQTRRMEAATEERGKGSPVWGAVAKATGLAQRANAMQERAGDIVADVVAAPLAKAFELLGGMLESLFAPAAPRTAAQIKYDNERIIAAVEYEQAFDDYIAARTASEDSAAGVLHQQAAARDVEREQYQRLERERER